MPYVTTYVGQLKSCALPVFHALADRLQYIRGKGKKSAWQAWQASEEVTDTFGHFSLQPFEHLNADSNHFTVIERFVVLYDKTSPLSFVNVMQGKNCSVKEINQ